MVLNSCITLKSVFYVELSEVIKGTNEITNAILHNKGYVKTNGHWIAKDDDEFVAPDDNTQIKVRPSNIYNENRMITDIISYEPSMDHDIPLSQFEQLLLPRVESMTVDQWDYHEFYATRF